jgi:Ser/Thr protein kinase RdoA (MazF antagonist)
MAAPRRDVSTPPDVTAWSGLRLDEPLTGGVRNPVWAAHRGGQRLVVRHSGRSAAALDWELDLLAHLDAHGIGVPVTVPADDGRRHVRGVMVQRFVEGRPPTGPGDWSRVVAMVTAVHQLTAGWPQRPGFAAAADLRLTDRGGDVRLDLMPADAVAVVRDAWRPVLTGPTSVVHGDVGGGNLLVDGARVTLLDWDESRVDVPWFDFAFLPDDVAVPTPVARRDLVTAGLAWEVATCWAPEPGYAARRLAELRTRVE